MPEPTGPPTTDTPAKPVASQPTLTWTIAAPALLVFLWSTGFIGAKWGLPYAEPFTFLALRFAIAAVVLAGFAWAVRAPWPSSWSAISQAAVVGIDQPRPDAAPTLRKTRR